MPSAGIKDNVPQESLYKHHAESTQAYPSPDGIRA